MCLNGEPPRVMGHFAYVGDGDVERLCRSVVGEGELGFFAVRPDGVIVFLNEAVGQLVGLSPQECVGRNIVEWLHPSELERAAELLSLSTTDRPPPGTSRFWVKHADGSFVPLEISAASAFDGADGLLVVQCRNGAPRLALEDVVRMLLEGVALGEVLRAVCNLIEWQGHGSHVAISWYDGRFYRQVDTGLPPALGGGDGARGTIWHRSRSTHEAVVARADELGTLGTVAESLGLAEVWVVPVEWSPSQPPATITIWTVGGGRSPRLHTYGMEVAQSMVELILRWDRQQASLQRAAHLDALTGLANRRLFFDRLEGTDEGGAILYCDLDRFKPVNDILGHAAGDEVLRAVAKRISNCVRSHDLVARLGGDEFAVLCEGASSGDATEVASRIQSALDRPVVVEESEVTVGVSIGIAHNPEHLDGAVVEEADAALAEAKASGRHTYRVAPRHRRSSGRP